MKCLSCGADIELDPYTQKLKCAYCGNEFSPEDYKVDAKKAVERKDYTAESMDAKIYTCTQCGGSLLTFDETAVTFCSYCGSNIVIEPRLYKEEKPEYVIPFKITKEQCAENYKKAIKKFPFAPNYMTSDVVIEKFRGIYMPYGIYRAIHHGTQVNNGEKYSHRSGYYDYYDQYRVETDVDADFEGMSYDLASEFQDKYSHAIAPFNFNEAKPFNVAYLSGYYADTKDVDKNIYNSDANMDALPLAKNEMRKNREFAKYGVTNPTLSLTILDAKTAYYPVYFLAIRNSNKTINYAVVNGETGKVAVEMPIDYKKYILWTAIVAVPIFIILNLFLTLKPNYLVIVAIVANIIALIISLVQNSELKKHDLLLDDRGYTSKNSKKSIIKSNVSVLGILEQSIGIIISIIVLLIASYNDILCYIAATISIILVTLSFTNLIKQYNNLTGRKLAQLNARGGDEHA